MKRRDLIRRLTNAGWRLYQGQGHRNSRHDIYKHDNRPPGSPNMVQVPRHTEIKELTAKGILEDAGLQ